MVILMDKTMRNFRKLHTKICFSICLMLFFQFFSVAVIKAEIKDEILLENQENGNIKIEESDQTWLFPSNFISKDSKPDRTEKFPSFDQITGAQYLVVDLDSEEIILEKNIDDIAYPASMTKILTALTILEAEDFDLDKRVVFSEYAVSLPSPLSVNGGFVSGEETTTENAMYLMMVASANDCARALAETYAGSETNFAKMMNEKARQLGCENTNMVDAAGFGLEDHYVTPRDLFKIIKRAMTHDFFRELVRTEHYLSQATSIHNYSGWSSFTNSNKLLLQGKTNLHSQYLHSYDGVKTGTTDIAGYCLSATVYTYDGRHLCGIIFDGSLTDSNNQYVDVSILLRGLLEEAAMVLSCPTEEDTYQFLADHPKVLEAINKDSYDYSLSFLQGKGFVLDQEIEEIVKTEDGFLQKTSNLSDKQETALNNLDETIATNSTNNENTIFKKVSLTEIFILLLIGLILTIVILLIIKIIKNLQRSKIRNKKSSR